MLLWSTVIQIIQIQLSTNTHFWVINWKPHIENFSRAATLHLCNMADSGEKLQQPHCYHPFSDSRDTYLTKNHYENYSPKMVPTNPTGSWTHGRILKIIFWKNFENQFFATFFVSHQHSLDGLTPQMPSRSEIFTHLYLTRWGHSLPQVRSWSVSHYKCALCIDNHICELQG